jgi:aspartate/methionine/tyrosine aminotransferase
VSSAGKTFRITGWKFGWCVGPSSLIQPVSAVHTFTVFSVATPLQRTVADALSTVRSTSYLDHESYFHYLRHQYTEKKETLMNILQDIGLAPFTPEGSFFIIVSYIKFPAKYQRMTSSEPRR